MNTQSEFQRGDHVSFRTYAGLCGTGTVLRIEERTVYVADDHDLDMFGGPLRLEVPALDVRKVQP